MQAAVRWAARAPGAGGAARRRQRPLGRVATRSTAASCSVLERMDGDRDRHRLPGRRRRAGAFNVEVKRAAAEHGLWYPPDPSSYEICSIGGNVATNAGGLCCVKYGVTTDYVLGLDVVLADGTLVTLGGKRIKDVAGLSLLKLFVGSEGTLGIVTRAILRLVPAPGPRLDAGGARSRPSPRRPRRRRRGRPHDAAVDDGADGPAPRSTPSRTSSRWGSTARPARCWSPSPTPPATARAERGRR